MAMVDPASPPQLQFSIIVATRNRPKQLGDCLEQLSALDFPREKFEVIVVDDGSDSPLEKICAPFRGRMNLRYVRSPRSGVAAARNYGVTLSHARFIALTDDDVAVDRNWLSAMENGLTRNCDALVGGKVVNGLPANIFSVTAQLIVDAVYAYYNADRQARFFACNNLAFSRERFREISGFVEPWPLAASEDRVFCRNWRGRGWPMIYAPDAIVRHAHHLDLWSFCEMYFRYGRGAALYHSRPETTNEGDTVVPKWAFYRECLRRAWNGRTFATATGIILLMMLWQLANAAGYFSERFGLTRRPSAGRDA